MAISNFLQELGICDLSTRAAYLLACPLRPAHSTSHTALLISTSVSGKQTASHTCLRVHTVLTRRMLSPGLHSAGVQGREGQGADGLLFKWKQRAGFGVWAAMWCFRREQTYLLGLSI